MKKLLCTIAALVCLTLTSCTNNYSNGNRVGYLIKFSERGLVWKSWEGEMNLTQTGMATNNFEFSIDNDHSPDNQILIDSLQAALISGKKIEVSYHEVFGLNWFGNRGETDYFINQVRTRD